MTKISLDEKNRMLRIGIGKHDGKWFFRIDLWWVGFRMAKHDKSPEAVLNLHVCEIYRSFGNAYAEDDQGHRFLVNTDSKGVCFDKLEVGQPLRANVSSRNFVVSVDH